MSERFIDFLFVKANADFAKILANYNLTPTRTRGAQLRLNCPFHDDTRPSCEVNTEKRNFHCFSCDAKGNAIDFVARMEGLGEPEFRQAALKLAEICGIPTAQPGRTLTRIGAKGPKRPVGATKAPQSTSPSFPEESRVLDDRSASEHADNPPLTFALKVDPAHPYLAGRGISPGIIETFRLGYASRGVMRGRIVIPIHNATGELVAYLGRWASDEVPEDTERYKFPDKFKKHLVLYNLHRLERPEHVAIVESAWSVFRLHALGFPAVALLGSSIASEQVSLLARSGVKRATILLDGDQAGRKAREKVAAALAADLWVHAPEVPDGFKPDEAANELLEPFFNR